jgi:tubulin--tyrosine ligase
VYAYNRILALFSAVPYKPPQAVPSAEGNHSSVDLAPHLTNTSLQVNGGEQSVRLLEELIGCHILSQEGEPLLTTANFEDIVQNVGKVLAETFKAALGNPVHFQVGPFKVHGDTIDI